MMKIQQGQVIANRYQLDKLLGSDTCSEANRVRYSRLSCWFGFNLLLSDLHQQPELIIHFWNEANALFYLRHPNIRYTKCVNRGKSSIPENTSITKTQYYYNDLVVVNSTQQR